MAGSGLSVTAKVTDIATIRVGWSDVDKVGILDHGMNRDSFG